MLTAAASLTELFGDVPSIGELVKDFDFSKVFVPCSSSRHGMKLIQFFFPY